MTLPGASPDHEMGVYGEVAKFLWFLCDSIKEEPDACYIMASEFAMIGIPIMMIMEPEWTFKKAQVCATSLYAYHCSLSSLPVQDNIPRKCFTLARAQHRTKVLTLTLKLNRAEH